MCISTIRRLMHPETRELVCPIRQISPDLVYHIKLKSGWILSILFQFPLDVFNLRFKFDSAMFILNSALASPFKFQMFFSFYKLFIISINHMEPLFQKLDHMLHT